MKIFLTMHIHSHFTASLMSLLTNAGLAFPFESFMTAPTIEPIARLVRIIVRWHEDLVT